MSIKITGHGVTRRAGTARLKYRFVAAPSSSSRGAANPSPCASFDPCVLQRHPPAGELEDPSEPVQNFRLRTLRDIGNGACVNDDL